MLNSIQKLLENNGNKQLQKLSKKDDKLRQRLNCFDTNYFFLKNF